MKNKITGDDFCKLHADGMKVLGFWTEEYRATVISALEARYKPEIIRNYRISDFIAHGNKVLVKWQPRHTPLSDQDLKEEYGYTDL